MRNASLQRRLGAMLYDGLLMLALMFLITIPFIAVRGGEPVAPGSIAYRLCLLLGTYAFFVGFWTMYGRTLGMQSWRIKIETPSGAQPAWTAASIRFFAGILSWGCLGLGFLWQLRDKDGLSWPDRLSNTRLRHYPKETVDDTTGS